MRLLSRRYLFEKKNPISRSRQLSGGFLLIWREASHPWCRFKFGGFVKETWGFHHLGREVTNFHSLFRCTNSSVTLKLNYSSASWKIFSSEDSKRAVAVLDRRQVRVRDPQQSTSNAQMESNLSSNLEGREGRAESVLLRPCSVIRPQNRPTGNVRPRRNSRNFGYLSLIP